MPLNPNTLANAIRSFSDRSYSGFTEYPRGALETSTAWAGAFRAYFEEILTPSLLPGTHEASEAASAGAMAATIAPIPGAALAMFAAGLGAYVAPFVAGGLPMLVIPPVTPFVLTPSPPNNDPAAQAAAFAAAVDAWARTGRWGPPPPAPPPAGPWS